MPASFDVLIIGAGAAGLAAARYLSGAGLRVCLIEARHRAGGRVHTLHVPDLPLPLELGAEFIHGQAAASLSIVEAAALHVYELPDNHWWSRDGKWELIGDFWRQIDRVRAKIRTSGRDRSFAGFLRTHRFEPHLRELALSFVEGYHASHVDRISAQALATSDQEQEDPGGNKQFRIANGYASLLSWLRAGLDPSRSDLLLGTIVTRIEWSRTGVAAHCRSGKRERTIRAHRAVITIPIGVWKATREQEGTVGGHAAEALLAEGNGSMIDRGLDAMASAFRMRRRDLDALLVSTHSHDWQADPFSRGAYSYAGVGGKDAHQALARPVGGVLFFAGEATSGDQTGTVAGAIDSGHRAAREILRHPSSRA